MNSDAFTVLSRFASGDPAAVADAQALFRRGWVPFLRAKGAISLDRCLGVDAKAANACNRAERDYWLATAHRQCEGRSPWQKSQRLERELARFFAAIWPAWRDLDEPPAGASELRSALFYAVRSAERIITDSGRVKLPTTTRRLHGIVSNL